MKEILTKRAYDPITENDGYRILVDRIWPRGISKEKINIDEWAKEITPTTKLRKDFHSGLLNSSEFRKEYLSEIKNNPEFKSWKEKIIEQLENTNITLVSAAHLVENNHVDILKECLLNT